MKKGPLRIRIYQFLTNLLNTWMWDKAEARFLLNLVTPKDSKGSVPIWARNCKVCNVHISEVLVNSHYMVHDELWIIAGFAKSDVACIQCLEKVLGRDIVVTDLTSAPINSVLRWALSKSEPKVHSGPYRESKDTPLEVEDFTRIMKLLTNPPCVNCGHPYEDHHWFNSEFIDCGSLGRRTTTMVNGVIEKHQLMANCKCERYKEK